MSRTVQGFKGQFSVCGFFFLIFSALKFDRGEELNNN